MYPRHLNVFALKLLTKTLADAIIFGNVSQIFFLRKSTAYMFWKKYVFWKLAQ